MTEAMTTTVSSSVNSPANCSVAGDVSRSLGNHSSLDIPMQLLSLPLSLTHLSSPLSPRVYVYTVYALRSASIPETKALTTVFQRIE